MLNLFWIMLLISHLNVFIAFLRPHKHPVKLKYMWETPQRNVIKKHALQSTGTHLTQLENFS